MKANDRLAALAQDAANKLHQARGQVSEMGRRMALEEQGSYAEGVLTTIAAVLVSDTVPEREVKAWVDSISRGSPSCTD